MMPVPRCLPPCGNFSHKPRARKLVWYFGEEAFRKELLERMAERMGAEHYGPERVETEQEKAERIVRGELKRRKWREKDLANRAKGDRWKVRLAARLRAETTMTVKWIARRLAMGSAGHVNNRLYRWRKGLIR